MSAAALRANCVLGLERAGARAVTDELRHEEALGVGHLRARLDYGARNIRLIRDQAVHAAAQADEHPRGIVDGPDEDLLARAVRAPDETARGRPRFHGQKVGLEVRKIAHGLRDENTDAPIRPQRLQSVHHRVVERHEHAVVLHAGGFDDLDHALLEPLVVAVRLELDDDLAAAFTSIERLGERRHALGGELRRLEAADVDTAQLRRVAVPHSRRVAADLHEVAVVQHEHLTVG